MSNEFNLKPCPFCGCEAAFIDRDPCDAIDYPVWDVRCTNGACFLQGGADWWSDKAEVAALWNARQ